MEIGIDLGGTKTEGVLLDAAGAETARQRRPTPQQQGYQAILENIASLVADIDFTFDQVTKVKQFFARVMLNKHQ